MSITRCFHTDLNYDTWYAYAIEALAEYHYVIYAAIEIKTNQHTHLRCDEWGIKCNICRRGFNGRRISKKNIVSVLWTLNNLELEPVKTVIIQMLHNFPN